MATKKEIDETIKAAADVALNENNGTQYNKAAERHRATRRAAAKNNEKEVRVKKSKVISGTAKISKPSIFQKIKDGILPDGVDNFGDYFVDYIIVPYIDRGIKNAVEGFLPGFGKNKNQKDDRTYIAYDSKYKSGSSVKYSSNKPEAHYVAQDFRNVEFTSLQAARDAVTELNEIIDGYGQATVLDFFDICGLTGTAQDDNWGWLELKGVRIVPLHSGYKIRLPEPISLL